MFKKTAIAAAVAGVVAVPMAAQADEAPTVYGFVNIGIENTSKENDGTGSLIFATGPDGSTHANDIANTRFGFKGSKDLGNGLSAGYKIEIGTGTTSGGRGGPVEDAAPWDKRIAQVSLSGGFGSLTLGNQWGILYEYLGWNVYRSDGHGGAAWYEATRHLDDDKYGLRVSNAYTYTFGGGGYSSDPFTFSVQVIMNPDSSDRIEVEGMEIENPHFRDETADAIAFAGAVTFGNVTLNAAHYSENNGRYGRINTLANAANAGVADVKLTGVGFKFRATDALFFGGTFMEVDRDREGLGDASSWNLVTNYDFGGGLSGMLGVGGGDTGENNEGDMSTVFLQLQKSLGSGVKIYAEYETAEREVLDEDDAETSVFSLAVKQVF